MAELFPKESYQQFASVIIPIAVPRVYTYAIPLQMLGEVAVGKRVEVQFGKSKIYAGVVYELKDTFPNQHKHKEILSIIDEVPIVTNLQLQFWKWISDYYCCSLGEVMSVALPSGLKLNSETSIILSNPADLDFSSLDDKEFMLAEALLLQNELTIADVQQILNRKTVYPIIRKLLEKKIIFLREELQEKFTPKTIKCLKLGDAYTQLEDLESVFEKLKNAPKQSQALLGFIQLNKTQPFVRKDEVIKIADVNSGIIMTLVKKGVLEIYERITSRLAKYQEDLEASQPLSAQQERAIKSIAAIFQEKDTILLQGVTGSGKTRVYVEKINEILANKGQVLYLLPEIALTTQTIFRLKKIFGDAIQVYHSRISSHERVEIWNKVKEGQSIVLGARSSIFLPFKDLQLIIVDEEHDPSYKQQAPAPRYHARDAAIILAKLHRAKVILGTATPSLESFYNTKINKYGLVEMKERYGGVAMPDIEIANLAHAPKSEDSVSHFTPELLQALEEALARGEQSILFQNRRGYAPILQCEQCTWKSECVHCDVSLTYHKFQENLRCHYCGYRKHIPKECPACGSHQLHLKGFGTEQLEEEISILLPDAKVARMDWDTVGGKNKLAQLLHDFEDEKIDILVGTQMVTKGLDFDNVGVVGVMSADQLLYFPDFRAAERAYQLMVQVSGRAGRKKKTGKVIIQAHNVEHPILKEVLTTAYESMSTRELKEREAFNYPPFKRLIRITLKHKNFNTLREGAIFLGNEMKNKLGSNLLGPSIPGIPRVRTYYLVDFLVKIDNNSKKINATKEHIKDSIALLNTTRGLKSIRAIIDVDS